MKSTFFERLTSKKKRLNRLKNEVLDYFSNLPEEKIPDDQKKALAYLKANDISVFPYDFTDKYQASAIEVQRDPDFGLYYMLWEGKKLYFKNGSQKRKAQTYFNSLRLEQDDESPHRYLTKEFDVRENDIVMDVGAAEGNFSLSVIEKVKHVYLFEPDKNWIKALKATFAPWQSKVTIVQKFVSDKSSDETVALDDIINDNQEINFIKTDVEGAEAQVLQGASEIIRRQTELRIAVCTYHRQEDADALDLILKTFGFSTAFSDGYMLYHYGRTNVVKAPYFRKAVLRATKK